MRKNSKKRCKLAAAFVVIVVLVLGFSLINDEVLTGNAIFDSGGKKIGTLQPLALNQLSEGVVLKAQIQIITWTDELEYNVPLEEALGSLNDVEFIVGLDDTDINKRWAGSGLGHAQKFWNDRYYGEGLLLTELRPGKRYKVYLGSVPQKLKYQAG